MKTEINFLNWHQALYLAGNSYVVDALSGQEYDKFMEDLPLVVDPEWEYVDTQEAYLDLEKGYVLYILIFRHIPTNKFYACEVAYSAYEGWEESDLVWDEVVGEQKAVTFYKKIEKNAEEQELPTPNVQVS